MKRIKYFAWMSAIALTGVLTLTTLTACSSSEDAIEPNPDYNPETNSVKTEFVINVTQPGERTRMTSANVGNTTFQGMNNMQLICFSDVPASDNSIASADKLNLTGFDSGPAVQTDNQGEENEITYTNNSKHVYTLYIPVTTHNFLFYATAKTNTATDKFGLGALTNNLASATTVTGTEATDIKFNLESIVSTATTVTTPQGYLTTILNGIKNADDGEATPTTWASKSGTTDPNFVALGKAYDKFTNNATSGDVRQGSSKAILNMVKELFDAVNDIYTNGTDDNAKLLAKGVILKIADYFTITATDATPAVYTWSDGTYKTGTDGATFNDNPYPESQSLPAGSAVITFDNTNGFSYVNNGTMGAAAVSTAYNSFTYPSQLTYYCNSGLWQSTTSKNSNDFPSTSINWVNAENWSGWTDNAVTTATRAVAMKDNITYGAAQLASTIIVKNDVTTFTDNAASVTQNEIANQSFDFSGDDAITLKVHGLLIGGQPDAAGYEYLPYGEGVTKVIYDRFSTEGTIVNKTGTDNYTLVLDNYKSGGDQSTVNVALEMTADKDFYGVNGLIKSGQKFYLIGSLNPAAEGLTAVTWANHTSFKTGDTGQGVDRVFIRDAKTEATFTLGNTCLQKAYSTIPDLRSTQMLFGLSVDLQWKTGLSFGVEI